MHSRPRFHSAALTVGILLTGACATTRETTPPPTVTGAAASAEPAPPTSSDPRVGLGAGWMNAEEAAWNVRLVSATPPSDQFMPSAPGDFEFINSDLAFFGDHVVQGNFHGWQIWDVSNPDAPSIVTAYVCPGSQNDVSVYGNLLFTSSEAFNARVDCGTQGVPDTVSPERMRGIRIFDISDLSNPRLITNVQTCRGSHTHTLVTDPNDSGNVYIYVSGSAPIRPASELAGCSDAPLAEDPNSALLRIEVIQVPLAHPEQARIVNSPRIFAGLTTPATHPEPEDAGAGPGEGPAPDNCHDITVYPALGRAGGACEGYGLLLDISDPANPTRIAAVSDPNFSYWHSATFNNDGSKILFTDEWGGGLSPKCRTTDPPEWGANAIFTIANDDMTFQSYYKLPVPQTPEENCVAHNGSLIPVPGRDIMVQAWYQGGISIFDWTDPKNPVEIAYFDRGPMDASEMQGAGSWSVYWYNGKLYSSEIARGLDILELTPSEHLSQNEINAAKLVRFDAFNAQNQQRLVWPANPVVAKAYLDQLERSGGLSVETIAQARAELDRAQGETQTQKVLTLTALATRLESEAPQSGDPDKVRALAASIRDLTSAQT